MNNLPQTLLEACKKAEQYFAYKEKESKHKSMEGNLLRSAIAKATGLTQ